MKKLLVFAIGMVAGYTFRDDIADAFGTFAVKFDDNGFPAAGSR